MKTIFAVLLLLVCCLQDASTTVFDREVYTKSKDNYGIKKISKPEQIRTEQIGSGYICSMCTQTIFTTRELIIDHEAEVSEVLDQVCYKLFNKHPSEEAACEALIKQELPYIVSLIKKKVQPAQICANLGLC